MDMPVWSSISQVLQPSEIVNVTANNVDQSDIGYYYYSSTSHFVQSIENSRDDCDEMSRANVEMSISFLLGCEVGRCCTDSNLLDFFFFPFFQSSYFPLRSGFPFLSRLHLEDTADGMLFCFKFLSCTCLRLIHHQLFSLLALDMSLALLNETGPTGLLE